MSVSVEQVAAHLTATAAERRKRAEARADLLRARLPAIAAMLRRRGARRIVLFGSLAGGHPGLESDVDLATAGLAREVYFDALADAMDLAGGPVDLVRLEDAPPSLVERIAAEGRPL